MKKKLIKNLSKLQADILSNFGNTAYQRVSKDIHLENIPDELYEFWYSPNKFSFSGLIDLNNIQYLSDTELLEYYSQLISLNSKLETIFNKIKNNI